MNKTDLKEFQKEPCPAWAIEDYLQYQDCFTHNGHSAHLDSYLTVFEFDRLDKCLLEIKEIFTREQWVKVTGYWESNAYLSPNQLLLSKIARRVILK